MKKKGLLTFLIITIVYFGFQVIGKVGNVKLLPSFLYAQNISTNSLLDSYVSGMYNDCELESYGLDKAVFKKAMTGFFNLRQSERSLRHIISIIDFKKPSTDKRLWIIDLAHKKVLYHTLVAHGKNSGDNFTVSFSNIPDSYKSSLGFYLTRNTYQGKHGLSLILDGLDKDINHNAKNRSIVMHGAEYVSEDFIKCNGRLGRSHGCPAVPVELHKEIIATIQNGSILFIHHSQMNYNSALLNQHSAESIFATHSLVKNEILYPEVVLPGSLQKK